MWYRITAPHFCAGLKIEDDKVKVAAPVLKWTVGKSRLYLESYCRAKNWNMKEF